MTCLDGPLGQTMFEERNSRFFWPPLHLPVRTQVFDKNHLRRISKPIYGIKHSKPQIKFSQLFETQASLKKWRVVHICMLPCRGV